MKNSIRIALVITIASVQLSGFTACDQSIGSNVPEGQAPFQPVEVQPVFAPVCGNGIVEAGEECDVAPGDFVGLGSVDYCQTMFGYDSGRAACDNTCTIYPAKCYTCGDGVAEASEVCDVGDLRETCESLGYTGGNLACNETCRGYDESGCFDEAPATCGNGIQEADELCDGTDMGGNSCLTPGFSGGTAYCDASCMTIDTSACY